MAKKLFMSIGIDLAWTKKKPSAIVVLSNKMEILAFTLALSNLEIVEFVQRYCDKNCIVAIDAPLIFPKNYKSFRKCDFLLRKKGIKILPVQKNFFLKKFGCLRGVKILKELQKRGFVLSIKKCKKQIIEVYPYATLKQIFGKFPKYKNVSKEKRKKALTKLCNALFKKGLLKNFFDINSKYAADIFDAYICAIIGILHYLGKTNVIGDGKDGFIAY